MKRPSEIKRALKCIGFTRQEDDCAFCPYRNSVTCQADVVADVEQYIARLEQRTDVARTGREGRIRTVYLYTVTDSDGRVMCKEATQNEAAAALGFASVNGFYHMWRQQSRGADLHGVTITRRKGLVGSYSSATGVKEERAPFFVYTVRTKDGLVLLERVNANTLAERYGLTREGINSKFYSARKRGNGDTVFYNGEFITRIKTKRGERCGL